MLQFNSATCIAYKTWFITANDQKGEMQWQQQAINSVELVDLIDEAMEEGLTPSIELCSQHNC